MRALAAIGLVGLFALSAYAQGPAGKTIEGYWQDEARRILFDKDAPADYVYGRWTLLDQQQTYPTAKHIRRSAESFDVVDLLYDNEEVIRVLRASDQNIEFTRTSNWTKCTVHHHCGLEGDQLLCALRTLCPEQGAEQLVWRGEERYVRRASCEKDVKPRAQAGAHRRR